jgi:hypothetical protein
MLLKVHGLHLKRSGTLHSPERREGRVLRRCRPNEHHTIAHRQLLLRQGGRFLHFCGRRFPPTSLGSRLDVLLGHPGRNRRRPFQALHAVSPRARPQEVAGRAGLKDVSGRRALELVAVLVQEAKHVVQGNRGLFGRGLGGVA